MVINYLRVPLTIQLKYGTYALDSAYLLLKVTQVNFHVVSLILQETIVLQARSIARASYGTLEQDNVLKLSVVTQMKFWMLVLIVQETN